MATNTAVYEQRRRQINDDYNARSTANTFARNVAQQRFQRDYDAFTRQFKRQQPQFTALWGRRGMGGQYGASGAYQQAFQQFVGDFDRGRRELELDWRNEDQQYVSTAAELERARQAALADLEREKALEIALAALEIQSLRPFFS